MIEAARPRQRPGHLEFRDGDLREWRPDEPPDVGLANAVLQFTPDHLKLLRRWAGFLAPGGELGVQLPASLAGSTDSIMDIALEQIESPAWRDLLSGSLKNKAVFSPLDYRTTLGDAGLEAEAWETAYSFPLTGAGSVAQYSAGSVIRPALSRLSAADAARFLAEYADRLRARQPARQLRGQPVEILRQRRVFAVGRVR